VAARMVGSTAAGEPGRLLQGVAFKRAGTGDTVVERPRSPVSWTDRQALSRQLSGAVDHGAGIRRKRRNCVFSYNILDSTEA
jgi:hypothetical protein